jgi:uncharacterized repeat protein (TIGR03806 family)
VLSRLTFALCTLLLCTCTVEDKPYEVRFHSEPYPNDLSAWNLFKVADQIEFAAGVTPYDLNMPLFSDYAQKLRTLYIPLGSAASYRANEAFEFPVGTIVSKTFFYFTDELRETVLLDRTWDGNPENLLADQIRLIETRLLVRQEHHWDTLPYIWQGNDAKLTISGDLLTLPTQSTDLNYLVPSRNQCASCHATNHTTGLNQPIGLKARHLNRIAPHTAQNQLTALTDIGQLSGLPSRNIPKAASLQQQGKQERQERHGKTNDLDHKARTYLDINCGHCHNAHGAADTSGLLLDYHTRDHRQMGVCKPPIAAGRGSGGFLYSIVPGKPEASILTFRMTTNDPGAMMPELGRALVHAAGVDLITEWIASLEGECR